ncbi:hypothetical protein GCM10010495_80280 [Kitasatospora herbaricolor]|uniref:CAP domain-containing protein n=1 Tax=Kitasatospora herbaricolor TaxID=68217 RepID=UPI00174E6FD1|nr:CAP domain-containing protein [Kitasatospora herbaricolor]MDQ0306789.1 RNA polymerase sigma factor (sigma-70 family) [Kitasatospora herbaricolor]GGV50558.1 hypothetical protein GCM10010495_80280 [Kitasatospora herbaricolor]
MQELLSFCLPMTYAIVERGLTGQADIDDVVQETMLRAIRDIRALRDPERFKGWLSAIALHQVDDRRRRLHRDSERTGMIDEAAVRTGGAGASFTKLSALKLDLSEQRRRTVEAARWLDPVNQDLLSLWWLEIIGEMNRCDVAAALGLSPAHAAVRIQRMHAQLQISRTLVEALNTRPRCAGLQATITAWDNVPCSLWRKRTARHLRRCAACAGLSDRLVRTERLLADFMLVGVPAGLLVALADRQVVPTGLATGYGPSAIPPAPQPGTPSELSASTSFPAGRDSSATAAETFRTVHQDRTIKVTYASPSRRRGKTIRNVVLAASATCAIAGLTVVAARSMTGQEHKASGRVSAPAADGRGAPGAAETPAEARSATSAPATPSPVSAPSSLPSPGVAEAENVALGAPSLKPTASGSASRATGSGSGDPAAPPKAALMTPLEQRVVDLTNDARDRAGCKSRLKADSTLVLIARDHVNEEMAKQYFGHTSPSGETVNDRAKRLGFIGSVGENLAAGSSSPDATFQGWYSEGPSGGHYRNIVNCDYTRIGVGYNSGGIKPYGNGTWSELFS